MSISSSESKAIGLLRFSLIILIVFGHMRPNTVSIQASDFSLLSGHGISNVIAIVLSYLRITNQAYFLISGYLFWQGMDGWDWNVFTRKIKTRSKTLLLPYVLWIVFSIGTFVALMLYQDIKAGASFSNILEYLHGIGIKGFWNYHVWGLDKVDWLGNPTPNTAPFVLTLWFVRDLMVVTLFAPLLYWLFKKTKMLGILLLMFCYISKIWPQIDGFTIEAFFFFGSTVANINVSERPTSSLRSSTPMIITVVLSFATSSVSVGWYGRASVRIRFPGLSKRLDEA